MSAMFNLSAVAVRQQLLALEPEHRAADAERGRESHQGCRRGAGAAALWHWRIDLAIDARGSAAPRACKLLFLARSGCWRDNGQSQACRG